MHIYKTGKEIKKKTNDKILLQTQNIYTPYYSLSNAYMAHLAIPCIIYTLQIM